MSSWSISSPSVRMEGLTPMPPSAITATSVVPPPMSTIMQPCGSITGSPAPMAAALGPSATRPGARPGAARRAAHHALRLGADGEHFLGDLVDGDDGGLIDDDAAAAHHHQGVGGPQVDTDIVREDPQQGSERVEQVESLRLRTIHQRASCEPIIAKRGRWERTLAEKGSFCASEK